MSSSTDELLREHLIVRRIGAIAQKCSEKLYGNEDIPIEEIQIISAVMEEFIDAFHHGKEEKAYFPIAKSKDGFSENVRDFMIEHELGRRIAIMLRRELAALTDHDRTQAGLGWNNKNKEPVARFLKAYAVFVTDHTGKEDLFFRTVQHKHSISQKEDDQLVRDYESCRREAGGLARIEELMKLIEYLEGRAWMK